MRINVDINRQRVRKDGRCAVRMDVHLKGRARFAFPFAIEPARWDGRHRRVKPGPLAIEYNRTIANAILQAERLALEPGMTAAELVGRLGGPDPTGKSFVDLARAYNEREAYRLADHTLRIRETVVKDLDRACPGVTSLTADMLRSFDRHLVALGIAPNTVRARMKMLRTMYRGVCEMTGVEARPVFRGLIRREEETQARGLSTKEVRCLERVKLLPFDERLTRDAFLLSMYCGGIRCGDLLRLGPQNLEDGGLAYQMSKSGKRVWVPLIPQAQAIIDTYAGGPYILPVLKEKAVRAVDAANASLNRILKRIAVAAKINPAVSMHWARHSFALWASENDVPLDLLRMIFGHSSLNITQRYMRRHARGALRETFAKLG